MKISGHDGLIGMGLNVGVVPGLVQLKVIFAPPPVKQYCCLPTIEGSSQQPNAGQLPEHCTPLMVPRLPPQYVLQSWRNLGASAPAMQPHSAPVVHCTIAPMSTAKLQHTLGGHRLSDEQPPLTTAFPFSVTIKPSGLLHVWRPVPQTSGGGRDQPGTALFTHDQVMLVGVLGSHTEVLPT